MKGFKVQRRTLALIAVLVPLLALLVYVALRSGPLAPAVVTVAKVESRSITPALFGIGTVEARHTYKIGPTFAGRVSLLNVQVGDPVRAGQTLGEMDPVDLDDRVRSQESAFKRTQAVLREVGARHDYAQSQARRYEQLFATRLVSEEVVANKRQELQIAEAALAAAREDLARAQSDNAALSSQRRNLKLVTPVDGVVAVRNTDPGTTVVAGQAVVEVIDPKSLWINVRFDQSGVAGLAAGQPARIVLRSRNGLALPGHVLRVEIMADAVTEETLAKISFDGQPEPLPPLGELAEITVDLPTLPSALVIPNAALRRSGDQTGVWRIVDGDLQFAAVVLGTADLEGHVQVQQGLESGDQIVVYSDRTLNARRRIRVVERIPGTTR